MKVKLLDFEKPINDLYLKIEELKHLSEEGQVDLSSEIIKIEKRAEKLKIEIYKKLSPRQIVQIARHPERPDTYSLCQLIFDEVIEKFEAKLPKIVSSYQAKGWI